MSADGQTLAVASWGVDIGAIENAGAIYVYVRDSGVWTLQQRLTASDASVPASLGCSVAISGDTIVAGACLEGTQGLVAGAAYVFVRSGAAWTEQQKLLASDGTIGAYFGNSVSVSGDTILVGARAATLAAGSEAGAVYVFTRSVGTWTELQKLTASDAAALDWFGHSVSVSGDLAVIGAPYASHSSMLSPGATYAFRRVSGAWLEAQKLIAADASEGDLFGYFVAIDGTSAIAGAPVGHGLAGAETGAAYVFVEAGGTWTEQQKLVASNGVDGDSFGLNVAIRGDEAMAGAIFASRNGDDEAGAAYLFRRDLGTWDAGVEPMPSDRARRDQFGVATAIGAGFTVVGSQFHDVSGMTGAGAAYVFGCSVDVPPSCSVTAGIPACGVVALSAADPAAAAAIASVAWSSADCPDAVITPDATDVTLAVADAGSACRACTFEATAASATGLTCTGSVTVVFADTTPPSIARSAERHCLWPPNHRMACFSAADFHPSVADDCSASPVAWRFVSCASNQPDDGTGDGDTAGDCEVAADGLSFCVRAERDGADAAGRAYGVVIEARDACGNASRAAIGTVFVAHDRDPRDAGCRSAAGRAGGRRPPRR